MQLSSYLLFRHERMRKRWRVVGYPWRLFLACLWSPKNPSQPRAFLVPSWVSGTIYRFCWGLLLGSKGPQGGVREAQGPMPPHRVLGSGSRKFLFTCDFPPGITSHNPTFSNIKVFRSPLRNCSGGVHASPIIILSLQ